MPEPADEFAVLCERLKARLASAEDARPLEATARQAAVALILRWRPGVAELLVIKRAERPGDHWSGNLALPGGRWQAGDPDLLYTAARETFEEVGIDLAAGGEALGRLETIRPRNPLIPPVDVTPFVFVAPAAFHLRREDQLSPPLLLNHEVAAAFWVSVDLLRAGGRSEVFRMIVAGEERAWPAYASEHGPIWGMTEYILTNFLALIG